MKKRKIVKKTTTRARPPSEALPKVTLGAKGRVVIPASVRRALGLKEGDSLAVSYEGQKLVLASRRARLAEFESELGELRKKLKGRDLVRELDDDRAGDAAAEDRL